MINKYGYNVEERGVIGLEGYIMILWSFNF